MSSKLKIGIIGVGMVGEPIRHWFSDVLGYKHGQNLFCYDADRKKGFIDDVNRADIIFIAVPTPPNPDGSCNISIVQAAAAKINDGKIVIIKSTVPPGTVQALQNKYPKKRFIFNPEFLTESQAWEDFVSPDRQIVAHTAQSISDTVEVLNLLPKKHFIRPWATDYSKRSVNSTEAELAKYASNVFGFMKVCYGNLLADVCYALNLEKKNALSTPVSYDNIREIISADLRIGAAWLDVEHGNYCGAGGYCFPKDLNAFLAFYEKLLFRLKKKRTDKKFIKVFTKGLEALKIFRDYNAFLLAWQNLSIEDVSKHNRELVVRKRKKIRI